MTAIELRQAWGRMEGKLNSYSLKLTANRDEAMDLCQETMMKAFINRDKLKHNNVQAWLFSIMKNIFINDYRRKLKKRMYMQAMVHQSLQTNGNELGSPLSSYYLKEIMAKIEVLEEDFQVPFKMFLNGFKYKEIAEHLQLPMGTVKSRIFLGRQELAKQLNDYRSS
ncbi:MAG: RNA polymerase sigma factor [Marinifilaceae bacterium]|jgi:RNA polymerase sigma-70 factor (ECF subfamily)